MTKEEAIEILNRTITGGPEHPLSGVLADALDAAGAFENPIARGLASVEAEAKAWPEWKRNAASDEPHVAIPDPAVPQGLTRNDGLRALADSYRVAPDPDPSFGDPVARRAFQDGAKALLRLLIERGAFTDGRNWADCLPLQPWERAP